ncbi:MAG: CNNM domain-containing protein [Phycisphaerales bacterium]
MSVVPAQPDLVLSGSEVLGYCALSLAGLIGSALCAGGEMGCYTVNRVRLNLRARAAALDPGSDEAARVLAAELEHPARLLAVLLVGYNLFSYFLSLGLTALLEARGYTEWLIIILSTVLIGPVLFVLIDTLPKELFRAEADTLTYAIARPVRWFRVLLTATLVLPAVQATARFASHLLGGGDDSAIPTARERMAALLKEGVRHGALSESQVTLLDRAMALRDATVRDEMTPWPRVHKLPLDTEPRRALELACAAGSTRFPVVDARGQVVGVVNHLDLALQPGRTLADLMQPPVFLSPGLSVRAALLQLSETDSPLAVVIADGRPVGVATAKDLVEPLTGELAAW